MAALAVGHRHTARRGVKPARPHREVYDLSTWLLANVYIGCVVGCAGGVADRATFAKQSAGVENRVGQRRRIEVLSTSGWVKLS